MFSIALLLRCNEKVTPLFTGLSILADYYLSGYYASFTKYPDVYRLLHMVSPLCAINCVTLSSYYVQCILLFLLYPSSKWIRSFIQCLLASMNHAFVFLFASRPLLLTTLFLAYLDDPFPPPSVHYGPYSYMYANGFPELLPFLQTVIRGLSTLPFAVYLSTHAMSDSLRYASFYLPILLYGEGPFVLAYALLFLLLQSPAKAIGITGVHCFTVSLYYDLCSDGADVFALLFYTECVSVFLFLHEYVSLLSPLC